MIAHIYSIAVLLVTLGGLAVMVGAGKLGRHLIITGIAAAIVLPCLVPFVESHFVYIAFGTIVIVAGIALSAGAHNGRRPPTHEQKTATSLKRTLER